MASHEARYRYRLRVNPAEVEALKGVFDSCRFVWNQALGRWNDLWRYEGVSLRLASADKELTDWRSRFEWLAAQPSVPEQQVLRDLFASVSAFFDKSNPAGRPNFKKRQSGYATARWTKNGFKVEGTGLGLASDRLEVATAEGRLPLRVVWSRPLPSTPTSVTIYRDRGGRYWASFVVRVEMPLAPVAATVANQRADFHHKTARRLVADYDRIGVEDLRVKNMSKKGKGRHKSGLNRSIADAGWGQFRRTLEWQATKAGKDVVALPARNTTQKCSSCGAKAKPRIELSDRVFRCRECGLVLGRDRNAARNLNPDRIGTPAGGSEPAGVAVPVGDDGSKPKVPAGTLAA